MNVKIIHTKNIKWVDIVSPSEKEIHYLEKNFSFFSLDYQDVLNMSQHAKIEARDKYYFIVLLFPVFKKETREIIPSEVDIFVGKDFLVTIHDGAMYTMKNMFKNVGEHEKMRQQYMSKNTGYLLYQILEPLLKRSFPILDHISKDMNEIEKNLFSDLSVAALEKISLMKRNIIDFRKIVKTHHLVLKKMTAKKDTYINFENSKEFYTNLLEHSEHVWDILAIQKETAEALQDANQSMATNRLNEITKVITLISAIFLPATTVIFLFDMNLQHTPFHNNPYGFWLVLGIAAICSIFMVIYFKIKKWF